MKLIEFVKRKGISQEKLTSVESFSDLMDGYKIVKILRRPMILLLVTWRLREGFKKKKATNLGFLPNLRGGGVQRGS